MTVISGALFALYFVGEAHGPAAHSAGAMVIGASLPAALALRVAAIVVAVASRRASLH